MSWTDGSHRRRAETWNALVLNALVLNALVLNVLVLLTASRAIPPFVWSLSTTRAMDSHCFWRAA